MYRIAPALLLALITFKYSTALHAELIWDNGPLSTGGFDQSGDIAPPGSTWSELHQANSILGVNVNRSQFHIADDFTLTGNYTISELVFFAYQTGSSNPSAFDGMYAQIWDAAPDAGGTVVWGDMLNNILSDAAFSNIYRIHNNQATTNRPIMELTATGLDIELGAGTYWLELGVSGTSGSGPWAPTVTFSGLMESPGANAKQFNVRRSTWSDVIDRDSGAANDFAFRLSGVRTVPEPASTILITAPTLLMGFSRRRNRHLSLPSH
ncbi:MAG: hypothetical protein R3C03_09970 [Pirellulaceae bacterium]